jgi:capsular polysaccharide transport system permease protein
MNKLLALPARVLQILLIALPLAVAGAYLAFIAADRYVSEAKIAVQQSASPGAAPPAGMASLLTGLGGPSIIETLYVQQYVHSLDLLQALDKEFNLRAHYSAEKVDVPFRLPADASLEEFHEYWRKRVEVEFDNFAMVLTIRVQAFDPAFAHKVNRRILEFSDRFVNETTRQMAREQMAFAEGELKTAAQRVEKAQAQLLAFQNRNRVVDPLAQAQASIALTSELQASLSRRETELKSMLSYLNESAPQVKTARADIKALREQLDAERTRIAGSGKQSDRLNNLAMDFQSLKLQVDFATDAYKMALSALESARIEATRKVRGLITVEPPTLPQTAHYPLHLYVMLTVLVLSILIYTIVRLILATVREHQD